MASKSSQTRITGSSPLRASIVIHKGDVTDALQMMRLVRQVRPDEIYHLAAQTHASQSFDTAAYTMEVNTLGTLNMLEAVVSSDLRQHTRLYNASTSEMFGGTDDPDRMLSGKSALSPKSPYAISKLSAYWLARDYRDAHGLWIVNGILFNHESPRRGLPVPDSFGSLSCYNATGQWVCDNANRASCGIAYAGLIREAVDSSRDGHGERLGPCTGLRRGDLGPCCNKRFLAAAFKRVGISLRWPSSTACAFRASDVNTGEVLVQADPTFQRPVEVQYLLGDDSQARYFVGWSPTTSFYALVKEMVDSEIRHIQRMKQLGNN